MKAGSHLVQVYFVQKTSAFLEDLFDPYLRRDPYRAGNGEPGISSVTITGPPDGAAEWSRLRPSANDSPSRRRLFVCQPASAADEAPCATKDHRDPRAARVSTAGDRRGSSDPACPIPRWRESRGGFESGLELAVRSILVSPKFLFRFESQPETAAPNTAYRITDLELASRLSFFLWSSIPDDELLNVAEKKTLHDPAVLEQQVRRMLADPRSEALVSNFAGQWLHIRNVSGFRPSPELLFHFDDNLRQAFERETELFFDSIIRENRSVLDLLDADYTFLNERLARHYGIPGVYGERFRRVSLPADSVRRGLLGQGSILTGTSRREPDLSGDPREMDPGEYFRRAAATAACERARAEGREGPGEGPADARADGATPGQSRLRELPCADGRVGVRAREFRRDRRVARHRCGRLAD